ncbi:MAG TPA: FecR domain-containing protein [Pyrinomonadaceae bacterium]|nr:FecR domain-containing protein [Pyrinomonadaceae bacterium]
MFSKHVIKDISAYCHGELSAEESRQFAEHIISCVKCRSKFDEIKLGVKLAEQLPLVEAPESLWRGIEAALGSEPRRLPANRNWQLRYAAAAAVLVVVGVLGVWLFWTKKFTTQPAWQVQSLDGTPRIGNTSITKQGRLAVGEWLETDASSRAQIAVGSIGTVDIDENTRVRLLETQPTEHRLELARGKMSAMIWAPPRLFFVDTPSAVAADLGCAYTLEVDEQGAGLLRVTSGWVALELKDRESFVPAGAVCETRPGVGPGTPYFEDAPTMFRAALQKIDFEHDASARSAALDSLLSEARPRDTLTLWHLLARVDGADRVRVYDKMALLVPPPAGVTREGVLELNQEMLDRWKSELELNWNRGNSVLPKVVADGYFRVKNGVSRRLKEAAPR